MGTTSCVSSPETVMSPASSSRISVVLSRPAVVLNSSAKSKRPVGSGIAHLAGVLRSRGSRRRHRHALILIAEASMAQGFAGLGLASGDVPPTVCPKVHAPVVVISPNSDHFAIAAKRVVRWIRDRNQPFPFVIAGVARAQLRSLYQQVKVSWAQEYLQEDLP